MTLPTISQGAPFIWLAQGGPTLTLPTVSQGAPFVWAVPCDQNGNYINGIVASGANPNNTPAQNSAAIAAAVASLPNNGTVLIGPGLIQVNNIPINNFIHYVGSGIDSTILQLASGANTDLFSAFSSSVNLVEGFGGGSNTGVHSFSIENMTIDGNKAGQSSGPSFPIQFYGYSYALRNLLIKNGFSGAFRCGWNPSAQPEHYIEPRFENVYFIDSNGIGVEVCGPTDGQWSNIVIDNTGSHGLHLGPNASAQQFSNLHVWGPAQGVTAACILDESNDTLYSNCEAEGSDVCECVLLGNGAKWTGGRVFASPPINTIGFQLGQGAASTLYPGMALQTGGHTIATQVSGIHIMTGIDDCQSGAINEINVGNNVYFIRAHQLSGTAIASNGGFLQTVSTGFVIVSGLTPDGTHGKDGVFQLFNAAHFNMYDPNDNIGIGANLQSAGFNIYNGRSLDGYSDGGSTNKFFFDSSSGNLVTQGKVAVGSSATSPDPGAGGTVATANIGQSRLTPTANRTLCVLAPGTTAGQEVTVINNSSSFTVSWAAQATSHIAGETGGTFVLAANGSQRFSWDNTVLLWYKV